MNTGRPFVAVGDRLLKRQVSLAIGGSPDVQGGLFSTLPAARRPKKTRRLVVLSAQEMSRYKSRSPLRMSFIKERACLVVVVQQHELRKILDAVQLADGLVFREINLHHLKLIAELAESGYVALPAAVASQLVNKGLRRELLQLLSGMEYHVLTMLGRGSSNRVIGAALNIDEGRTKYLIRSVFRKLHLQNRTQAAVFARDVMKGLEPAGEFAAETAGGKGSRFSQHLTSLFS